MLAKKTIVVTGSNKGIGYTILEALAKTNAAYEFIMAVRTISNGQAALENLAKTIPDINDRVKIEELDVSKSDSIDQFVSNVSTKVGKIDALINNAGMAYKGDAFDSDIVKNTFQTNFYGTVELSEKMLGLINDNGKIITVGSTAGKLRIIKSDDLKREFEDPDLNREKIFGLAKRFYDAVADNTYADKGFPKSAYGMSKLCINLYTMKVLARHEEALRRNIQVYALCPGWCRTDMAGDKAPKSAEEGAETPVYLTNLPWEMNNELQGQFFYESKVSSL